MGILKAVLEKPFLDGRERDIAGCGKLGKTHETGRGACSQSRDRRMFEQLLRRDGKSALSRLRDYKNTEDAIAAEFEEIIVDTDTLDLQQTLPDFRENAFCIGSWRSVSRRNFAAIRSRRGQRAVVELAVVRERHALDGDKRRRHHVVGNEGSQMGAEFGGGRGSAVRNKPRNELLSGNGIASEDGRLANAGMCKQMALDFAKLDSKAADFHLLIDASEILDVAIWQPSRKIACPVESRAGSKRVFYETLSCEFGPTEVFPGKALSTDEHFPRNANRHRPQLRIEDEDREIRNRLANHAAALEVRGRKRTIRNVYRRLGDAVHIHELRHPVAMPLKPRAETLHFQGLAAEHDSAKHEFAGTRGGRICGDELAKCAGRLV